MDVMDVLVGEEDVWTPQYTLSNGLAHFPEISPHVVWFDRKEAIAQEAFLLDEAGLKFRLYLRESRLFCLRDRIHEPNRIGRSTDHHRRLKKTLKRKR